MVAPAVEGIDLFKVTDRSISRWSPSFKMGATSSVKQPFCSQLEERLLLWLDYQLQVASYACDDIGPQFAATYRLPIPEHAPFAISYTFENKSHEYLPDMVGRLTNGKPFIDEAGMEDDKRSLAKAEAARRLAHIQGGTFWIMVTIVECPDSGSIWTLSPRGGVVCFKSHDKRKTTTSNIAERWTMRETIWEVVGGENK